MSEEREGARAFVVEDAESGLRLDAFVAARLGESARAAARLCQQGAVLVDGRPAKKGSALFSGARVEVRAARGPWLAPARAPAVGFVYVDDDVVVIDKPAGVPTHPLERGKGGTAADALCALHPECAVASSDEREGGLVHRLDTYTSGLLAAARSRAVHVELRAAFTQGRVGRAYLALVEGRVARELVVDAPVAHDSTDPRRMVAVDDENVRFRGKPKPARSRVTPVATSADASLVVVRAAGGRRHQVRVHLASAGHPLLRDELYGGAPSDGRPGHLLHAAWLALPGRAPLLSCPPSAFLAAARARGLDDEDFSTALSELAAP